MTDSPAPLATGPLGMRLLAFERVPEDTVFATDPVGYSLVAARHRGRLLLVHVRHRDCWELPGGTVDPGETPRRAAARELAEESGQLLAPERLAFTGFARTALPGRRVLRGAVFHAEIAEPAPFEPTEEIAAIHWWDPRGAPPPHGRLQTVDVYVAALDGS